MVSFQCNGCGDVFTKPKLDKHRAMCHSSFDCIDCSKRFETPADYKGHSSCISEAEKYQKTLYNGGSGPGKDNRNQRSWPQGGGSQRGHHRPQWQRRDVNRATGANDTPLGTPIRMSPVNDTPVLKEDAQEGQPAVGTSKKRKAESETTESKGAPEPAKKKKKQKTAGREADTIEVNVSEEKSETKRKSGLGVTITERTPYSPSFQSAEDGNRKPAEKRDKEKRKKKEEPILSGQQQKVARLVKKSKSKEPGSELKAVAADRPADLLAPAESPQSTTSDVLGTTRDDPGGRKKRRQPGNHRKDDSDEKRVFEGSGGSLKEKPKEKKKKRKSQSQTGSVVE